MRSVLRLMLRLAVSIARVVLDEANRMVPYPDGPPRAHAPGRDSFRILVVGNGVALGAGVRSHDLALPGALARAVSARTDRGVDVDLIADPRLSMVRLAEAVRSGHPERYDCIVMVSGGDESVKLEPLERWRRGLVALIADVNAMAGPNVTVMVTGVPAGYRLPALPAVLARFVDVHAAELDRVSGEVCASSRAARFVSLEPVCEAVSVPTTAVEGFATWAELIADELTGEESVLVLRDSAWEIDEVRRQASVDDLGLTGSGVDPRLQRIVGMARRAFGTETALFTVLDGNYQHNVVRSGSNITGHSRSQSFCRYAILERGGMIIEDARTDERFRENPLVTGNPHIRFYAGFPIDSPDGERVGALCILDPEPRRMEDIDISLLRELAQLVQAELWRYIPVTVKPSLRLRPLSESWTAPRGGIISRVMRVGHDAI